MVARFARDKFAPIKANSSDSKTRSLIGAAASEKSFKAAAAFYLRLHLATHGALDNHHPLASHLLLTPTPCEPENDGLLEAREIMALQQILPSPYNFPLRKLQHDGNCQNVKQRM